MPLYLFYTMVQKSQKWPKTQIKGGPALIPAQKWPNVVLLRSTTGMKAIFGVRVAFRFFFFRIGFLTDRSLQHLDFFSGNTHGPHFTLDKTEWT